MAFETLYRRDENGFFDRFLRVPEDRKITIKI